MSLLRFTRYFRPNTHALRPNTLARPNAMESFFKPSHSLGLNLSSRSFVSKIARNYYRDTYPIKRNIIYGTIGLNCSIFAYYHYLRFQTQHGAQRDSFVNFVRNFTMNLNEVRDRGRWWTILTSNYTHFHPFHLLGNMLSFYYMATLLAHTPAVTPIRLVTLIMGAGLSGSFLHLYKKTQDVKETGGVDRSIALGFSGAVMGVGSLAACLYPRTTFLIYGIVPVPLWLLMGGYFVYDGYYLNSQASNVGHGGHIGGVLFGLAYFARLRFLKF